MTDRGQLGPTPIGVPVAFLIALLVIYVVSPGDRVVLVILLAAVPLGVYIESRLDARRTSEGKMMIGDLWCCLLGHRWKYTDDILDPDNRARVYKHCYRCETVEVAKIGPEIYEPPLPDFQRRDEDG